MAKIYTIKCPECGQEFEVTKGILVNELNLNHVPKDREEETPFDCPFCGHTMSVEDEDFNTHVVSVMMAD